MIPPVVQSGDVFQLVRMPDDAGAVGKSLRVASVSGSLMQMEWIDIDTDDIDGGEPDSLFDDEIDGGTP